MWVKEGDEVVTSKVGDCGQRVVVEVEVATHG